jgi:hypothetical protein
MTEDKIKKRKLRSINRRWLAYNGCPTCDTYRRGKFEKYPNRAELRLAGIRDK